MAPRRAPAQRRAALRRGARAEIAATAALLVKGYSILARRYSGGGGEIDLIVRRGATIAFVEVKARADIAAAAAAIGPVKEARFARAVRHWLVRNPAAAAMTLRCDAVLVAPWRWPRHVPDAFGLPF
jgi:putative endonuclease